MINDEQTLNAPKTLHENVHENNLVTLYTLVLSFKKCFLAYMFCVKRGAQQHHFRRVNENRAEFLSQRPFQGTTVDGPVSIWGMSYKLLNKLNFSSAKPFSEYLFQYRITVQYFVVGKSCFQAIFVPFTLFIVEIWTAWMHCISIISK